jgi:arylsulfatase A-like enzyme
MADTQIPGGYSTTPTEVCMKAIMVMFDSLNRRMLPPYGCDWVHAPNFSRLAQHAVTFDRCYAGSLPCMPARRELHTGRYNFLHRSWGPVEPFDDSMPQILSSNGVYTHLVTDHYHYFEDGGSTYHNRYNSWQCPRGQEGDPWWGQVKDPDVPDYVGTRDLDNKHWRQDWINRQYMQEEDQHPQHQTFTLGMDFMRRNADQDNWFLQLETFDPHEPYFTHQKYKDLYPHDYNGHHYDWPDYARVAETDEEMEHLRYESAALHSMCDDYLGRVLDLMNELDLWKDTMLIVNTDHGFLLGEHDWLAKCVQPFYDEVAHTPFFVWDPRSDACGEHRQSLVQTIDIAPTLLDYFGTNIPKDMQGVSLKGAVADDTPVREAALFGMHGSQINCTDGRWVYMRAPDPENRPLFNYTVMPTHHMIGLFPTEELATATLAEPFSFTKGCPTLKTEAGRPAHAKSIAGELAQTMLFDMEADPAQEHPVDDADAEKVMIGHMVRLMQENDAPPEQYERMRLQEYV